MKSREFVIPNLCSLRYLGEDLASGPKPTLIYFSLCAQESLELEPYNSPAKLFAGDNTRVISFTLPGHGEGFDKHKAMLFWAEEIAEGKYTLEKFLDETEQAIRYLIENKLIDPAHLALAGLSRGAFIATHLAAREPKIQTLLGFAPLTQLSHLESFSPHANDTRFQSRLESLKLLNLTEKLTHLKHCRFYISNHDTWVSTDACYAFIRALSTKVHEKRARHCNVELILTPPIGHKGHGTAPHIFEEGIEWLKRIQL